MENDAASVWIIRPSDAVIDVVKSAVICLLVTLYYSGQQVGTEIKPMLSG